MRSLPEYWAVPLAIASSFTLGSALTLPQPVQAQTSPPAPTFRYAQGEDVDLAEIIAEWRGYYADVPIYLCVCQDDTCDQTEQWPYREYTRYQTSVALGPTNGQAAEASGTNCFDIADGSRPDAPRSFSAAQVEESEGAASPPDDQPETPTADGMTTAPPVAASDIPTATVVSDGAAVRLDWPSGASNEVAVTGNNWSVSVLDALDCPSLSLVEQKTMQAQRVVGEPVVDSTTGNVAVPVLLDSCIETDQSAVFVLDANEGGGYALYRAQLPGDRVLVDLAAPSFPNEFTSYPFSTISDMRYWDGSLLVRQGSASGAESIVIFRPAQTPAGFYAGCAVVTQNEGASVLCPDD
ncbi:hypothetical protein [Leptolyngbya sp. BC1307]|uniref:hypothetical protein n=1 Tax=Leptolyngbya sp. BC1307 TaxID=2029589 RepID=UPI000EFB9BB7|nr:hypothetical protein [Leptolyngbya sp. BC1307]